MAFIPCQSAAFLGTLSPGQWPAPTLCAGWRVNDVVTPVISYGEQSLRVLGALTPRTGFRPGRINSVALAQVRAEGFEIEQRQRFRLGLIERLAAPKPVAG